MYRVRQANFSSSLTCKLNNYFVDRCKHNGVIAGEKQRRMRTGMSAQPPVQTALASAPA